MSIRNVLRHRATVKRPNVVYVNGSPRTTWTTVAEGVPVLLDAIKAEGESVGGQETQDRQGVLLSLPASPMRAGDRIILTRGQVGSFEIGTDPAEISTLIGPSHREHRVVEVG